MSAGRRPVRRGRAGRRPPPRSASEPGPGCRRRASGRSHVPPPAPGTAGWRRLQQGDRGSPARLALPRARPLCAELGAPRPAPAALLQPQPSPRGPRLPRARLRVFLYLC